VLARVVWALASALVPATTVAAIMTTVIAGAPDTGHTPMSLVMPGAEPE
jgi:hypothetical protein